MSESIFQEELTAAERKAAELEKDFSFDGYKVVRKELFAHQRDPAMTIRRDSVTFNAACITGLEDAVWINIMVNEGAKKVVVVKCDEDEKNALRWCIAKDDKRRSRQITGRPFSDWMYDLIGWDKRNRYKLMGYRIKCEYEGRPEDVYLFDLLEAEIFDDTKRKDPHFDVEENATGEKKGKESGAFAEENLTGTYGVPYGENKKALKLDLDGFVSSGDIDYGDE